MARDRVVTVCSRLLDRNAAVKRGLLLAQRTTPSSRRSRVLSEPRNQGLRCSHVHSRGKNCWRPASAASANSATAAEESSHPGTAVGADAAESSRSTEPSSGSSTQPPQQRHQQGSSWGAQEADSLNKNDYLANLGKAQDYNINVDHGQSSNYIDHLFTGKTLGAKSDIADGTLRGYEFRKFDNLVGDYYVAPAFLEAVAVHMVKNYVADSFDKNARVPLILGIWGGKGQGKSFQTELAFKKMGIEAIVMSAGEMESDRAGAPGFLIRQRYRMAAQRAKARGKLTCLLINDIDAGLGHFQNTQFTVNNQIVHATLMAICDDPNRVSVAAGYRMDDYIQRVPIIVTANDLSYLFAPLVREGRMDKYYWKPTQEDLVNILWQMYKEDGLAKGDMGALLEAFPGQALDFFGALRSATYDAQIRRWIVDSVGVGDAYNDDGALAEWASKLARKQGLPKFEKVDMRLDDLLREGQRLAGEQAAIRGLRLSDEYMKKMKPGRSLIGLQG
ncbi:hypothetical protein WJX84_003077 [Apatococcus fuscideae]|uniref:Ribulose bisphosphate carboxylase/oxygenase activase, chloroplastic n=1 Tax=Apatococcus fuscideae TaxID=2026836 RepID=A0AAW1T818_9CHLO